MKGYSYYEFKTISTPHITTIRMLPSPNITITIQPCHHTTPPLHIPITCPHITGHHTTQPHHHTTWPSHSTPYNPTTTCPPRPPLHTAHYHYILPQPVHITTVANHHHCHCLSLPLGFSPPTFLALQLPRRALLLPISGLFSMPLPERQATLSSVLLLFAYLIPVCPSHFNSVIMSF